MGTDGTPRVFLKEKMIRSHDSVYPLMIDPLLLLFDKNAVNNGSDPPVTEGGTTVGDLLDEAKIIVILLLDAKPSSSLLAVVLVRARYIKSIRYYLHGISSFFGKGPCDISFFSRAISIASFKISTSMVFLPRRRSSSRIWAFKCLTSDAGTTGFFSADSDKGPLVRKLSPPEKLAGVDPIFPGNGRYAVAGFFRFVNHRLLLCRRPAAASLYRCYDLDRTHTSPFSLVIVIILRLLLQPIFGCMSVRFKRGLLQNTRFKKGSSYLNIHSFVVVVLLSNLVMSIRKNLSLPFESLFLMAL